MSQVNDQAVTLLPDEPTTAYLAAHSEIDQRLLAAPYNLIRTEREGATCSLALLPFLAWERSVHHYTGSDEATDRARTDSSFEDHASYGSPVALETEIQIDVAYPALSVRDWFEVKGFAWPDFQVVVHVADDGPALPAYSAVVASAIKRKNVRDWPGHVSYEARETATFGIAAVPTLNGVINLLPLDPTPGDQGALYYGAAGSLTGTVNLLPF